MMNANRAVSVPTLPARATPRPVAAALAGIGFAAALLAPAPAVFAAEASPAVVARELDRDSLRIAQAVPHEALNDPSAIAVRSPSRNKALITVVVDSTADTAGLPASPTQTPMTLRQALQYVNTTCNPYGPDTFAVHFAIPGAGPHTISTNTGFSLSCSGTVIDGYTQPGSSPNSIPAARDGSNAVPQVVIDGSGMTGGDLISLGFSSNMAVRGLALTNWPTFGSAIHVSGSNSSIGGNFIGVGATGTACSVTPGASKNGIGDGGFATSIGGPAPSERNVIGCATGIGISLSSGSATVHGNIIGAAKDGVSPAGNQGHGISLSATGDAIGGQGTSEGNVIAHNGGAGVQFGCFPSQVSGNDIFLNALTGIDSFASTPTDAIVVTYAGGNTSIAYSVSGFAANQNVMTEFFDNSNLLLGLDQGQQYFASCAMFTIGGNASCTATVPGIYRNLTRTFTGFSQTSNFYGSLLTPDMSPSTTSLNFGTVPLGGSSAVTPLTITNPGPGDLYIDSMALSLGDYRDTTGGPPPNSAHWCGLGSDGTGAPLGGPSAIPVAAGTDCVMNLVFTPQSSGARNATLTLTDAQSPANGLVVNLLGSGSVTPPTVNWGFAPVAVLQNVASQLTLSITNPNGATFTNTTFAYSLPPNLVVAASPGETNPAGPACAGSFVPPSAGATSFTVNGLQVMSGATCAFALNVSSAIVGSYPVTMAAGAIAGFVLAVPVSNAASNTATLTVNAPATPALQLAPGGLNFGSVTVGSPAPAQSTQVSNVGTANLVLSAISLTPGDFTQTNTCPIGPPGLAAGGNCSIDVGFTPTALGTRSADITIASNAASSPDILPLTGNGVAVPTPIPTITPSGLTFPTQTVGTTSAAQSATLTNGGTAPLLISSIITEGDFAQSNACPPSLAPAAFCDILVTFGPVAPGTRSGFLKVFDNASGSPHFIPLTGTATVPAVPTISAPASVGFPPTVVGGVSAPVTITITNVGGGALTFAAVEIVGSGYAVTSQTCTSAPVAPSQSCTVTLTFAPDSVGNVIATLRLVSNAPGSPTLIGLTGEGTGTAVGTLAASPGTLDFGTQEIGTTTPAQAVVVTNAGSGTVAVSGVTVTGDYAQSNNCSSVASGNSCTINITFTASATGSRPGSVSVASDASNSPLTVNLSGTGAPVSAAVIELSASSLTFGNRIVGAGAQVQSVTLRNKGGAPLAIGSFTLTGEFVQSTTCGATVAAGESCRIDVGFLPTIPGARLGKMTVTSNASNGTQVVDLAGTGCRFTFFNRTQSLMCQ